MSTKTLSCKVRVAELNRFSEVAQAQGETKASLLQRLVLDYLQSADKVDAIVQSGGIHRSSGVDKGLPTAKTRSAFRLPLRKSPSSNTSLSSALPDVGLPIGYLPPVHRLTPTTTPISKPAEYSGLPSNVGVDAHSSVPLPKGKLPDNHTDAKDRPATSSKPSLGKLLLVGLFLYWLVGSRSKTAVDHTSSLPAQSPSRVDFGLPSHNADKSTSYSGMDKKLLGLRFCYL